MRKQKVIVLGGGMGAMSAAFALTHPRNPRRHMVEVTVLQLGWRLGGKGASGRSLKPETWGRIEEHGLHNLFGFYDNTFRLLRDCYEELARPVGHPHRTWRDVVSPESSAVFIEPTASGPVPWYVYNPTNRHEPGTGDDVLPLWDTIVMGLEFLVLNARYSTRAVPPPDPAAKHPPAPLWPVAALLYGVVRAGAGARGVLRSALGLFGGALADKLGGWSRAAIERAAVIALEQVRTNAWRLLRGRVATSHALRRQWIGLHFATTILIGLIEDGALERGLDSLNHWDIRQWLARHALDDGGLMIDSVLVRVLYDSSFAYEGGDTRVPEGASFAPRARYEAGTLLRGLIRANFTYKGAFGWKLNGATGDVLFAPLKQVLAARGVVFKYFHAVEAVRASDDGRAIVAIDVAEQATPRGTYEPLVDVGGVPSWPNEPRWDQLVEGEALRAAGVDLEHPRGGWTAVRRRTLRVGEDFDAVVLGIALGALPEVCADLVGKSERWQKMLAHVKTTRTQAAQVWMDADRERLGWSARGQPITGFWYDEASELNVWADMSHLLPWERWDGGARPLHCSYFVSPLGDHVEDPSHVRRTAARLIREHAPRILFPGAAKDGGFDWSLLTDRAATAAPSEARLAAQFYKANTAPSDRYVLSLPGSSRHRLPANDPHEFTNLFLAGDWTRNGLNSGAMESAVLGGLLASHALCGYPAREDIVGVDFL